MESVESTGAKPTLRPKPAIPPKKPTVHVQSVLSPTSGLGSGGLHQRTIAAVQSKAIGMAGTGAPTAELDATPGHTVPGGADAASTHRPAGSSQSSLHRPEQGKHGGPAAGAGPRATGARWPDAGRHDHGSTDHAARESNTASPPPAVMDHLPTGAGHLAAALPQLAAATAGDSSSSGCSVAASAMGSHKPHATVRTVPAHGIGLVGGSAVVVSAAAGHHAAAATKVIRDVKPPLPKHKPVMVTQRRQRSDSASDTSAVTTTAAPPAGAAVASWGSRAGSAGPAGSAAAGTPSAASTAPPGSRRSLGRSASFVDRTPATARVLANQPPAAAVVAAGGEGKHPPSPTWSKLGVGSCSSDTTRVNGSSELAESSRSTAARSSSFASKLRERLSSGGSKADDPTSGLPHSPLPTPAVTSSVSSMIRAFSQNSDRKSSVAKLPAGRVRSDGPNTSGSHQSPAAAPSARQPPAASPSARRPPVESGSGAALTAAMSVPAAADPGRGSASPSSAAVVVAATAAGVPEALAGAPGESDDAGYLLPRSVQPAEAADVANGGTNKTATLGSHHHYSDVDEGDGASKASTMASSSSHLYEDVAVLRGGDDNSSLSGSSQPDSQCQSGNGDVFCDTFDDTLDGQGQEDADSSTDTDSEPEAEQAKQDKKKRKAYLVAEEMMKTEAEFCDNLKLLNEDFRTFIAEGPDAASNPIVPPRLLDRILNYLPQLQDFSSLLTSDLTLRVQQWESNPQVADIFVKKGPFLKLYTTYITEFERATSALDEATRTYPAFAEKVREFESTERCRHLLLRHFMLKPIQRIPQYKLLLTDYLKYVTEDCTDHASAVEALAIVSDVAKHSNEAMKQDDSLQALLNIQNSLVGDFKVVEPSRKLLKKGELLKHSRRDKQVRMFVLFNDVLLMARPIGSMYKQKYILPLQNMKTSKPAQDDYENEFTVISKQKSFAVVASNPTEREAWFDAINKAIKDREEKLSSFQQGPRQSCSDGVGDDMVGEVAPVWIPDARVSMCMVCNQQFTVFFRRHHCRGCGKVVCSDCSEYKAPLKYDDYQACRVCGGCHAMLRARLVDNYEATLALEESRLPKLPSKESLAALFRGPSKGDVSSRTRTGKSGVLAEVHAGDAGAVSGYLRIFTKKFRWKRFWFVIKDHVLYKYNASQDTAAIESTVLYGYEVAAFSEPFDSVDGELLFKLHKPETALIEPIVFRTETAAAAAKWLVVMKQSVQP